MKSSNRTFFKDNLLKNDLVAAPMAGISHLPFRRILRGYFDGIIYSEMMSVEGVSRNNTDSIEFLDRVDVDTPLVYQFFGGRAESFAESIKVAETTQQVDGFDINMGCPVKKVIKAGGGCSLLTDLDRLKDIVISTRKATDKPLSIKIRVGLDSNKMVYNEVLNIAQSEGVDALVVHARTKADMFSGTIHYDILREIASKAHITIIGNGGVYDYESYKAIKDTGVDGVMVGRGMMKSPWVFKAIHEGKTLDNFIAKPEILKILQDMYRYMLEHADVRENKRKHYVHILRKFAVWFCKGFEDATKFRVDIYKTEDEEKVLEMIELFYSN